MEPDAQKSQGRGLASMYLPIWHMTKACLQGVRLKYPRQLHDLAGAVDVAKVRLMPKADRLRIFLLEDLEKIQTKHWVGSSGERLLQVASYLDPRFKAHPYATHATLAATAQDVRRMALESSSTYVALLERIKQHDELPDNQPLSSLAPSSKRKRTARRSSVAASSQSVAPKKARARELKERTSVEGFLFRTQALGERDERNTRANKVDLEKMVKVELERYDLFPAARDPASNPLDFWREHGWTMPHIAVVASHALGVPASTANAERLFSAAGRAVTRRRPRLGRKRAALLIFAHANAVRGVTVPFRKSE